MFANDHKYLYLILVSSDDDNNDDMTYICVNEVTKEEVFVIISETHIKEKDAMTGRYLLRANTDAICKISYISCLF